MIPLFKLRHSRQMHVTCNMHSLVPIAMGKLQEQG